LEIEVERITAKCRWYQEQGKSVPDWVRAGMGERFRRVEQIEQRIQTLLDIFASHGVLPLEFTPASSVGDLHLEHLGAQAGGGGEGVQQALADHFAMVYKVALLAASPAKMAAERFHSHARRASKFLLDAEQSRS
jgi:hypothetical protein